MDQFSNVLSEAASQIQQFFALLESTQYLVVYGAETHVQLKEHPSANARVRGNLPGLITLGWCQRHFLDYTRSMSNLSSPLQIRVRSDSLVECYCTLPEVSLLLLVLCRYLVCTKPLRCRR